VYTSPRIGVITPERIIVSTSYRHWLLLRMIPRYPRKIDTATIESLMERQGMPIHRRSIQRDLEKLSGIFPLSCDDRDKPYGWSWSADAPAFDIPTMSPPAALAYRMVGEFMSGMFPQEIFKQLTPHFRHADSVLNQTDRGSLKNWPDKVRTISRTQPLLPPEISPEVFAVVSDALLDGVCFQAVYLRRGETQPVDWTVNPLGLVLHDRLITLVCTMGNYCELKDVRTMHLHRIQTAERIEKDVILPEGFNLDDYLATGAFGYRKNDGTIHIKAIFEKDATIHLEETPLSADQLLTERPDGNVLVEATVADTGQLRWWLLGFGGRVEVLEPQGLRVELKGHAIRMMGRYDEEKD
jgi:predicted DNA-binding transcriptional regulator YafY